MSTIEDFHHISIKDFSYDLPEEQIAKYPLAERDQSKLLFWKKGEISDHQFKELPALLPPKSILVFNNTRVIRARLHFRKKTGALIEIFCLEPTNPSDYALSFTQTSFCQWKCIVGNLKKWKDENLEKQIVIGHSAILLKAEKIGLIDGGNEISFSWDNPKYTFSEILEACGNIPIPPYLNRESEEEDLVSYQTVYSKIKGSVAAPTAGLHFTEKVFDSLTEKGIGYEELTLHVGAGTFQPVKADTISEHKMHTEHFVVSHHFIKKLIAHEGKIIAVGTTSVRSLESLYQIGCKIMNAGLSLSEMLTVKQWEAYESSYNNYSAKEALTAIAHYMERNHLSELNTSTQIIILPGYKFKIIDGLVTNFHQPQSTLLLLIAAFLGEEWKRIYRHALKNGYRFLSYGDSNLYLK
jgi:S-adenosylmethionine:tRNA ribosyltransferase-isomerase